jgi:hypothetical protein
MKTTWKDLNEIDELLSMMRDYSWIGFPANTGHLKAEDFMFFDTRKEAVNGCSDRDDYEIILTDVVRGEVGILIYSNPIASDIGFDSSVELPIDTRRDDVIHRIDNRLKAELLWEELHEWGFETDITRYLELLMLQGLDTFEIESLDLKRPPHARYTLTIIPDNEGFYHIDSFLYEVKKDINVALAGSNDLNSLNLDKRMGEIDWNDFNEFKDFNSDVPGKAKNCDEALEILDSLYQLKELENGRQAFDQLRAKHWLGTDMEWHMSDGQRLREQYYLRHHFDKTLGCMFRQKEAYNLMHGRYVSKELEEGGVKVKPWYYWQPPIEGKASGIFRIPNSETLDVKKIIGEHTRNNLHFQDPEHIVSQKFMMGDTVSGEVRTERFVQRCEIMFDALSNRLTLRPFPPFMGIDLHNNGEPRVRKGRTP